MLHAAWYLARFYNMSYVKGVERNKNTHNSQVYSIYNVDSNSKYLN